MGRKRYSQVQQNGTELRVELIDLLLGDQFNSATAQEVRRTILDGSFTYCHKLLCPAIQNNKLPTRDEVTEPRYRKIIDEGIVSGLEPVHVGLDYDDSCNLSCPSCRTTLVQYGRGPEYEKRKAIQDQIIKYVFDKPHSQRILVTITGSGDPFGAKLFRDLLFGLDGSLYPNVQIRLHTNGVALTPAVWDKMARIHKNFERIMVSVDAGNEADYRITRRGGNWQTLLDNLEFLGQKKKENAYKFLRLNLIVQRDNFRGILDFIRLGKRVGATHCALSLLNDWGTWTREECAARTIWSRDHELFDEFLEVMSDPLLGDPIVALGNVAECRRAALARQTGQ
jgi:sulfatase maturation enzyme AslB (radical SAM superfamily)